MISKSKRYRLRPEFRQLFRNLAEWTDPESVRRLFQNPADDPQPKGYTRTEDAGPEHEAIRSLVAAGFLEVESTDIDVLDSPYDEDPQN
jgi:hypothetical protein